MKSFKSLLTVALLGLAVLPALAQPPAGGGGRGRGGPTPEQSIARIEEGGIKLTAEIKAKVLAIYTKAAADAQALPQDDTRRDKSMALRQKADADVKALLSPDDQKKFDALPAPQRGGGGNRGQGGGKKE